MVDVWSRLLVMAPALVPKSMSVVTYVLHWGRTLAVTVNGKPLVAVLWPPTPPVVLHSAGVVAVPVRTWLKAYSRVTPAPLKALEYAPADSVCPAGIWP
ncbi:hypothetical protein D3C71_1122880 [compost metagenome]